MLSEDRAGEEGKGCLLPADVLQTGCLCLCQGCGHQQTQRDGRAKEKMLLIAAAHPEPYLTVLSPALLNWPPQEGGRDQKPRDDRELQEVTHSCHKHFLGTLRAEQHTQHQEGRCERQHTCSWEVSRWSGSHRRVNSGCSASSGEGDMSPGHRKRSEEGHFTQIPEQRVGRVCLEKVTFNTLSREGEEE